MPDLAQVTKVLAARAEYYDRTASFPADSIAAIQDAGLLTATDKWLDDRQDSRHR